MPILMQTVSMGPARSLNKAKKQRTTLTLPSDSLTKAKNIARARGVNLSTVISEALSEGLRLHEATSAPAKCSNQTGRHFQASLRKRWRFWTALFWNHRQGANS